MTQIVPETTHDHSAGAPEALPAAPGLDRRQVLTRAGLAGAGLAAMGLLAACGDDDASADTRASAPATTEPANGAGAAAAIVKVSDVPVGGSVKANDAGGNPIIVSQPDAGTIVAMTAICPHKGCEVKPDGKDLLCPCHASIFTLQGQNVSGPAKTPLAPVDVHVRDGQVYAGRA